MVMIGLWHGITLNFVIWGVWHGIGLWVHKLYTDRTRVSIRIEGQAAHLPAGDQHRRDAVDVPFRGARLGMVRAAGRSDKLERAGTAVWRIGVAEII